MDPLDWALICELCGNSRMPYKALAKKFNISDNTVKNRINNLRHQGVIVKFGVCVSFETLGAESVVGLVSTDGSENVIELMKQIASQPMVCEIYRTSDRRYEYHAMVLGASETLGLKQFLRNLDGVTNVEMRPVVFLLPNKPSTYPLNTRGKRVSFTRDQLRVLKSLAKDARLPVSKIAHETGFTPRRVRKILRDLQDGGGVHFHVLYSVFALGDMEYRMRISYDDAKTTGQSIIMELYDKYPELFWWGSITTNEPIVDVGLIIDRPGKGPPIAAEIKAAAYTKSVEDFVSYPRVVSSVNRLNAHLWDLIHEAGL
ncbi:MAG: winged helix-turn-helix transcriptional regulator [Candidatus Sifarchaeia archaeon]